MASGSQGNARYLSEQQQQQARGKKRPTTSSSAAAAAAASCPADADGDDGGADYTCPICLRIMEEAYMTMCGHSFCYRCLNHRLELSGKCPACTKETRDAVFPNHMLNNLILRYKERARARSEAAAAVGGGGASASAVGDIIADRGRMDLDKVNALLDALQEKKRRLERDSRVGRSMLLLEFLAEIKRKKQEHFDALSRQLSVVASDIERVEMSLAAEVAATSADRRGGAALVVGDTAAAAVVDAVTARERCDQASASLTAAVDGGGLPSTNGGGQAEGFNTRPRRGPSDASMATRRLKLSQHVGDLEEHYFCSRLAAGHAAGDDRSDPLAVETGLDSFVASLEKFTRYTSFRTLATLNYNTDLYSASNIVSSVEFDKDADYFAVAGVTKRIKVFEYGSVIADAASVHYPVAEMACTSKVSCVAWSHYHKGVLASADYEGTVAVWDAFAARRTHTYQEHEKRCWCVDFNRVEPSMLASGSDDSWVKIWSTNVGHSVGAIDAHVNVCCVQFNPASRFHVAFGATDHCVHYYDLRHLKQPLAVLRGHRKAVSFIRFVNSGEIVSAAVDSQLRLWNVGGSGGNGTGGSEQLPPHCARVLQGHVNEKSFVGLATDGDYVACGSEDNTLCVYYKGLSKDLMRHRFDAPRGSSSDRDAGSAVSGGAAAASAASSTAVGGGNGGGDDEAAVSVGGSAGDAFVSAVAWKPSTNIILAANSQGLVKIVELI